MLKETKIEKTKFILMKIPKKIKPLFYSQVYMVDFFSELRQAERVVDKTIAHFH